MRCTLPPTPRPESVFQLQVDFLDQWDNAQLSTNGIDQAPEQVQRHQIPWLPPEKFVHPLHNPWCRILNATAKWDVCVGGNGTRIQKAGRVHAPTRCQSSHQNDRTCKFSKQFQHLPCLTRDRGTIRPRPDGIEEDFNSGNQNHRQS